MQHLSRYLVKKNKKKFILNKQNDDYVGHSNNLKV